VFSLVRFFAFYLYASEQQWMTVNACGRVSLEPSGRPSKSQCPKAERTGQAGMRQRFIAFA
jgi:hypothetical protein